MFERVQYAAIQGLVVLLSESVPTLSPFVSFKIAGPRSLDVQVMSPITNQTVTFSLSFPSSKNLSLCKASFSPHINKHAAYAIRELIVLYIKPVLPKVPIYLYAARSLATALNSAIPSQITNLLLSIHPGENRYPKKPPKLTVLPDKCYPGIINIRVHLAWRGHHLRFKIGFHKDVDGFLVYWPTTGRFEAPTEQFEDAFQELIGTCFRSVTTKTRSL